MSFAERIAKEFPKRCGCGMTYWRTVTDASAAGSADPHRHVWRRLAFVADHADDVEKLEMRNCVCGSTLAVIVEIYRDET